MKQLSIWATRNRRKAQFLLVIINILLVALPVLLGLILYDLDIKLPKWLMYVFLTIVASSVLFYPIRHVRKGIFKNTYKKRKTIEFIFLLSSFFVITIAVNGNYNNNLHSKTLNAAIVHNVEHISFVASNEQPAKTVSLSPEKTKARSSKILLAVFLITVILAAFLGLSILTYVLSCSFICAGASDALIFLTIFGYPLIYLTGTVFLVRYLIKTMLIREKNSSKNSNSFRDFLAFFFTILFIAAVSFYAGLLFSSLFHGFILSGVLLIVVLLLAFFMITFINKNLSYDEDKPKINLAIKSKFWRIFISVFLIIILLTLLSLIIWGNYIAFSFISLDESIQFVAMSLLAMIIAILLTIFLIKKIWKDSKKITEEPETP